MAADEEVRGLGGRGGAAWRRKVAQSQEVCEVSAKMQVGHSTHSKRN